MERRNISVASKNGYTLPKVLKAKQYLDEIGSNKRNFDFATLVGYYNEIYGTNESPNGCKCQSPKYFNGIQNFYKFGRLTLINNGLATESDFDEKKEETPVIENVENRIVLGDVSEASDEVSEDKVDNDKEEEKEEVTEPKRVGRPKKVKE